MAWYRAPRSASSLVAAAALSYTAACAVGATVALRPVVASNNRWVHHALYVATLVLSMLATSSAWLSRSQPTGAHVALTLMPAFLPLGLIPYFGTHTHRHPLIALAAAPFFIASFVISRNPRQRR